MTFYILKVCSSKGAFEAIPKKNIKLDLDAVEMKLIQTGYRIICNAKVILIIEYQCEVSIFSNGRLLLKTGLENRAKECADTIYELILEHQKLLKE